MSDIELMKHYLIRSGNRQAEFADTILVANEKISLLEAQLKVAKEHRQITIDFQDAPRNEAKELALEFVQAGGDKSELPRALGVRTKVKQEYDSDEMVKWLADNEYHVALSIKKAKLNVILRTETPAFVTDVETIEITCDTDLRWMDKEQS